AWDYCPCWDRAAHRGYPHSRPPRRGGALWRACGSAPDRRPALSWTYVHAERPVDRIRSSAPDGAPGSPREHPPAPRPRGPPRLRPGQAPRRPRDPPSPGRVPTPNVPPPAPAAAPRPEPPGPPENTRLRPALEALPAYVPGRPPADDGVRRFKVSSNESHFPPIAAVRDAAVASLEGANRYPDAAAQLLRERLGAKHGVDPSQIALSTGSVAVTGDLVRALVSEGDEVVHAWRSFEAYPILAGSHGGVGVQVPLTAAAEHDLEAMAAAITD